MPEMDGLQMTKKIRKIISDNHAMLANQRLKCGIWAITAMNENELEEMVSSEYLDGVSVKPMSQEKLIPILQ